MAICREGMGNLYRKIKRGIAMEKDKIVAVQRRGKDMILSIPAKYQHIVKDICHMKCTVVDGELRYVAVK